MAIYIFLLECLIITTIVNSLPQIDHVSGSLYLDNPGNTLAQTSDNPIDNAQAFDGSFVLSGRILHSLVLVRRLINDCS